MIQTDASEYELGAALLQNGQQIIFASKTLTEVESPHANIERECLTVCYSLEVFHAYMYGRHITVQNDHKPLELIHQKPMHAAAPHLQCMLLCLQKYDCTIQYTYGKEMVLAERLSLFPSHKENFSIELLKHIDHIYVSDRR